MSITTARLILTHFTLDDAPFIQQLLNTPSWLKYIGDRNVLTIEKAKDYLANGPLKSYEDYGFGFYCMRLRFDSTPIGMCGLVKRAELEDIDLGFALLPQHEGMGFAQEAARAVIRYARETLQLKKLIAFTLPENTKSVSLLEKLGFTFERNMLFGANQELVAVYRLGL